VEGAEAREEEFALGDLGRSRINQPVDALLHLGYLQLLKVLLGSSLHIAHITTRVTSSMFPNSAIIITTTTIPVP
jgi:hypothetical protein